MIQKYHVFNQLKTMKTNITDFLKGKYEVSVLLTYTLNDTLRGTFEEIVSAYDSFEDEEDQSTFSGRLQSQEVEKLVREIEKKIFDSDSFTDKDFVTLYIAESELKKFTFKKVDTTER